MFEELMQIIQQHGQSAVVNNPEVPNEHNDAVLQEAGQSIVSQLQGADLSHVSDLLQGNSNPLAGNIATNFAANIAQKFGISPESAQNIANSLIPSVLSAFGNKVQGGSFNVQDIVSSFSNGGFQSTLNSIGGKLGLDKDGDGDVDLGDLTKMFGK